MAFCPRTRRSRRLGSSSTHIGLVRCVRGGTSFLDYLIVLGLVALFVAIGAHAIGEQMNSQYMRSTRIFVEKSEGLSTAEVESAVAGQATEEATAASDVGFEEMLGDWRRWVDLIIVIPFLLLGIAWLIRRRRKRQRRRSERRSAEQRRAERLRDVSNKEDGERSGPVNPVPDKEISKVVSVHRHASSGGGDISVVALE